MVRDDGRWRNRSLRSAHESDPKFQNFRPSASIARSRVLHHWVLQVSVGVPRVHVPSSSRTAVPSVFAMQISGPHLKDTPATTNPGPGWLGHTKSPKKWPEILGKASFIAVTAISASWVMEIRVRRRKKRYGNNHNMNEVGLESVQPCHMFPVNCPIIQFCEMRILVFGCVICL